MADLEIAPRKWWRGETPVDPGLHQRYCARGQASARGCGDLRGQGTGDRGRELISSETTRWGRERGKVVAG